MNVLIIEPELSWGQFLKSSLEIFFSGKVNVINMCTFNVTLKDVNTKPDIVFLSAESITSQNSDLIERLFFHSNSIIFTSKSVNFAIQAIKYGAIDYLLKPFKKDELVESILRCLRKKEYFEKQNNFNNLSSSNNYIYTDYGASSINTKDVIRFEATTNYTNIFLKESKCIVSAKTLKKYNALVGEDKNFVRVHRSHLININYIHSMDRKDFILLKDHSIIPVSRRKKKEVFERITILENMK